MNTQEWLDLYEELKRANTGRNLDCFMLWNAYAGNLWNLTGLPFQQDRTGRIILRDTRRDGQNRNKPLVVNYLKAIVDDYVALLSDLPDVKVPAPGPSEEEQNFADRVERYHYGIWHASYMQIQMKAVAWWNSVMGTTAGIVWPDFTRKHPVFRFAAPYMLYSVPDAAEPFMLAKAIIAERYPIKSVKEMYPDVAIPDRGLGFDISNLNNRPSNYIATYGMSTAADGSIDVIKCFDKNEVRTMIGGKTVKLARHELGFCPVVAIPNILVPGSLHRYEGDIEQTVGLAQHASFIAQAYEEYVLQDIYSPLVVEGLMEGKVPEDIVPNDPFAVIPVNIGGKVYRLPGGNGSSIVGQEMNRTKGDIEYMTGVPQVRLEGTLKSSITTGRGIDRAQGPYFSRTRYRTDILSFFLERMNSMAVKMQEMLWPHEDFTLFGLKSKRTDAYVLKMNTDELQSYTFNQVLYSMGMGMDPMQRMVFAQQGLNKKSQLFDKRWALEFLGVTDRPEEMIKRIDAEQEKEIEREMRLRSQASGQAPAAPGANPLREAASAESGGIPSAPTLPSPVSGASAGAPTAPPVAGAPTAAPTDFGLNPHLPPSERVGRIDTGLGLSLIEQVARLVPLMHLRGSLWASLRPNGKLLLVTDNLADSRKVHGQLDPIYGNRVSVRVGKGEKSIPLGARDLTQTQEAQTTEEAVPV